MQTLGSMLKDLPPNLLRDVANSSGGRRLAASLGMNMPRLVRAMATGALDQALRGSRLDDAPVEQMYNECPGTEYGGCTVVRDAAGAIVRVDCPDQGGSGGDCGCSTSTNANCVTGEPQFAPCTLEQACLAYRYAPFSARSLGAGIVPGEPLSLFQRQSATRWALTILPVAARNLSSLESIGVSVATLPAAIAAVSFQTSELRRNPQGQWVWAWNTPIWVYGPMMEIKDGRCMCPPGSLEGRAAYNGPIRVSFELVTAPLAVEEVVVTVSPKRIECLEPDRDDSGKIVCPEPAELCGLTELRDSYTNAVGVPIPRTQYLWGTGLPPQEPVLNYLGIYT